MLATLRVRNFVLIDELELSLGEGLNVLTGETGAGKSIVVDALSLVLGARGRAELVRAGCEEAEVEAFFTGLPEGARAWLEARDLSRGDELVLRRVLGASGRSRAYVNGRLAPLADLAEVAKSLVDIASQHESVELTDPATHLHYLDAFAKLVGERDDVALAVRGLRELVQKVEEARARHATRGEREAFLRFQLAAVEEVRPVLGEDDELAREKAKLKNLDRIVSAVSRGAARLDADEGSVVDVLARTSAELRGAEEFEPKLGPLADTLDAARAEIEEAARTLQRMSEGVDASPDRLAEVDERLFALAKLKKQMGPTLADVLAAEARLSKELAELDGGEGTIAGLEAELQKRLAEVGRRAEALSRKRRKAAESLGEGITRELAQLGMGSARVVVDVAQPAAPSGSELAVGGARLGEDGLDRVEFLIAPNKGSDPRPLRKVASGGELSRALLALKRALADVAPRGTYVFDEVDTGVGGAVAEKIGRALADIAKHRQALCITHLAQIAALGDTHFVVEKIEDGKTTSSRIGRVDGNDRVGEIARMMSGAEVTQAAKKAAKELLRAR